MEFDVELELGTAGPSIRALSRFGIPAEVYFRLAYYFALFLSQFKSQLLSLY